MLRSFSGQFVVAAEADAARCYHLAFERLWSRRAAFDLICLENVPADSSLWQHCRSTMARDRRFRAFLASSRIDVVHQIRFPATHEDFLSALSYETRRKLRRYTRRLQAAARVWLDRVTDVDQVPQFLNRLDEIYRDTWQAKVRGYAPRNMPPYVKHVTDASRAGFLRSYMLRGEEGPVAFAMGCQYDGVYYFLETGYAPKWAEFSPGFVLMHLFFQDLFRHDKPAMLDFILGDQPFKRSFSNVRFGAASLYLAPPNRWRLVLRVQQALHFLSRQTVRALVACKVDRTARKLLRNR
jgi:hypothetical protein